MLSHLENWKKSTTFVGDKLCKLTKYNRYEKRRIGKSIGRC